MVSSIFSIFTIQKEARVMKGVMPASRINGYETDLVLYNNRRI